MAEREIHIHVRAELNSKQKIPVLFPATLTTYTTNMRKPPARSCVADLHGNLRRNIALGESISLNPAVDRTILLTGQNAVCACPRFMRSA